MKIASTFQHILHDGQTYRRISPHGYLIRWEIWVWSENDTPGRWDAVVDDEALESMYRELYEK